LIAHHDFQWGLQRALPAVIVPAPVRWAGYGTLFVLLHIRRTPTTGGRELCPNCQFCWMKFVNAASAKYDGAEVIIRSIAVLRSLHTTMFRVCSVPLQLLPSVGPDCAEISRPSKIPATEELLSLGILYLCEPRRCDQCIRTRHIRVIRTERPSSWRHLTKIQLSSRLRIT
jgi:hypothetical protein